MYGRDQKVKHVREIHVFMARGQRTFFVKGQIVAALGFVGLTATLATAQVYCWRAKAARDNTKRIGNAYVPIKLYGY